MIQGPYSLFVFRKLELCRTMARKFEFDSSLTQTVLHDEPKSTLAI